VREGGKEREEREGPRGLESCWMGEEREERERVAA